MTGGAIDFTNTPYTWIHVIGAAGITTNASATTAKWIVGTSTGLPPRIQNDTASALPITVAAGTTPSGIDLDAGIILSNGTQRPGFIKSGPGTMRLTNPRTRRTSPSHQGALRVDDMAALGSGTLTLDGGRYPAVRRTHGRIDQEHHL